MLTKKEILEIKRAAESSGKIECYSCKEGSPIQNTFNSSVCPEGWTINENPCNNNAVKSSIYEALENENIRLNKISYNYKDVMNLLGDSMGFSEFKTKPPTSNNFFKLYNENFYELPKPTHNNLIAESEEYVGRPINPRDTEIENLKEDIDRINLEINSMDKEHPYFSNGTILMHKDFNQSHVSGFGGISSGGQIMGPKYYMHSGKKRRISDSYNLWSKIKNRLGMTILKDAEIIIFLWPGGLDAINDGPPVYRVQDLFKSSYEINMYTP